MRTVVKLIWLTSQFFRGILHVERLQNHWSYPHVLRRVIHREKDFSTRLESGRNPGGSRKAKKAMNGAKRKRDFKSVNEARFLGGWGRDSWLRIWEAVYRHTVTNWETSHGVRVDVDSLIRGVFPHIAKPKLQAGSLFFAPIPQTPNPTNITTVKRIRP